MKSVMAKTQNQQSPCGVALNREQDFLLSQQRGLETGMFFPNILKVRHVIKTLVTPLVQPGRRVRVCVF